MALGVTLLAIAASLILSVIAVIAIVNKFTFPRLRPVKMPLKLAAKAIDRADDRLWLSILIPVRDEAAVIADTIASLRAQTLPNIEILILDDHSSDGTGAIAREAAVGDARFRVIDGRELPEGWLGKNWACHQLSEAAAGDWLVFTDADVQWRRNAFEGLAHEMARSAPAEESAAQGMADLITVWPTQITRTWGERLIVPLLALVVEGYLPARLVTGTRNPAFSAACGQCLAFRRAAYHQIGGHAAERGSIVEDIGLARRIKAAGLRLWQADGAGVIACRMYRSWREVRRGFAKNIIAGYGGVPGLLAATTFHWLIFVLPALWWISTPILPASWANPRWAAALTILGIGVRALTAAATRQRVIDALAMPISALLMTAIAGQALVWHARGGPQWKGRTIKGKQQVERGK